MQDSRTLAAAGARLELARSRTFRGLGDVGDLQTAFSQSNRSARAASLAGDRTGALALYAQAVSLRAQIDPSESYGEDDLAYTRDVMNGTNASAQAGDTQSAAAADRAGADLLARGRINTRPSTKTGIFGNLSPDDFTNPLDALAKLSIPAKAGLGLLALAALYALWKR